MRDNGEFSQIGQRFIVRGLASAAKARMSGGYISAAVVLGKIERRIAEAKQHAEAKQEHH